MSDLPGEIQVIINSLTNQRNSALASATNKDVEIYHLQLRIGELEKAIQVQDAEIATLTEQITGMK